MGPLGVLTARLVTPTLVLVFSLAFLRAIANLPGEAANYPRLVIAALGAFVVMNVLTEIRQWAAERRSTSPPAMASGRALWREWHRAVLTVALLIVYVYAVPRTGFYPATAGFLLLLLPAAGLRNPLHIALLTGGLLGGSYLLFTQVLQVLLPRGPLA